LPGRASDENRLRLLIDAVTDYAIYMLDATGHVATWNPGAERFKGYTADEIIGQHFSRFYTDEDRATDFPARALRVAAREGRFEAEGWRVRKDGSRFWAHVVIDPIRGDDGALLGFAKITRDITSKREQESALYESQQRFQMLVQGVRDCAIYMLDKNGRITNWNSGAEAIKGYAADEIVGQHFSRFYTEDDRAAGEADRALETALRNGKYEREAWRVRKDGSLFWAHVLIDPIFDEAGEHIGFAKVTRDETDRKKAHDELEETRAALAQSQKLQALGELAGGVAHDFNNLMTVILGAADFLRRRTELLPAKRQQYVDAIFETATRATKLTDQLLAFGRRRPLRVEVVDVNTAVDALSDMLSRTLGSRIAFKLKLGKDVGRVEADVAQLEMAIVNAVVNARDAMPSGGKLTITTTAQPEGSGGTIRVDISDTGLGMPQRVLERAFDPFFTTKPVGQGTGLGLSQIHGFAAQAGGRAELRSAEGQGTTVSIILPATEKPLPDSKGDKASAALPPNLRVLLVEDNLQVRDFAEELLKDIGCQVVSAPSGEEALSILADAKIDLVLSDVVMPGMSGVELQRQIKQRWPDLPILLATGYSEEALETDQRLSLVLKPYSAKDLAAAMADALGARNSPASATASK